ncbi:MAG: SPOR domain-containing protein [Gammaproteobacteria bacterium]|nr:SPOR domain-containing protein [Gammaproteobacteria bacterium]
MDDTTAKPLPARVHPLARAVTTALLAATLAGCAGTGGMRSTNALEQAQAAYARGDYNRAAQLLAVPAMQGDTEAQYALGYLYYYGRGVRQDRYRAVAWFQDASRLGHPKAARALAMANEQLRFAAVPPASAATAAALKDERIIISEIGADAPVSTASEAPVGTRAAAVPQPQVDDGRIIIRPEPQAADVARAAAAPAQAFTDQRVVITGAEPEPASDEPLPAAPREGVRPNPVESREVVMPGLIKAKAGARLNVPAPPEAIPRYTLQLLGSRSRADLVTLVRRHGLDEAQVQYVVGEHAGGPWYRLFYGAFASVGEAKAGLKALPADLHRHKPWVRTLPAAQLAAYSMREL